ncbi:EAL domain-containing protein [Noviherbaspirillum sp. ST9]|uniref:EAL domain-containing protein n=1 Tax=Noviherbaspirillum sp. ST9 TaxID=3401606 RepID=UPI003B589CB4
MPSDISFKKYLTETAMARRRLPFNLSAVAVLALIVGLIGATIVFVGMRRLEHDKVDLDFQQRASLRTVTLRQQLTETVQVLKFLNQLFATVEPVSREQFGVFTDPLLQRHPYVQAFNFHRFVADGEREAYELRTRRRFPGFAMTRMEDGKVVPAEPRARHLVVDYIEPMYGNEAAFGLDVSHNAELVAALEHAIDTGAVASTGLINLAQGGGKLRGFLVLMPVYRHGMPLNTVEGRRKAAIGDTAAVFNATYLVEQILQSNSLMEDAGIGISVYAAASLDEQFLVFRKGARPFRQAQTSWLPHWIFHDLPEDIVHNFDVAGRTWRVVVSAEPKLFFLRHDGSLYTLIGGILFSMLLAAFVQVLASRSRRVHKLVEQRSAELRQANELLIHDIAARKRAEDGLQLRQRAIDASANAVIITSAVPPKYPIEYVNPAFERITGYSAAEVVGRSCSLLWAEDRDQPEIQEILAAVREKRETHAVLRNYGKDGRLFWSDAYLAPVRDESDEVNHFVVALYDITATKRYQAELEFQANRDTLTGLANRNLLQDRLRQASAYAVRYGHPVWVLFLNLDRFKFVNDTLGHRAGDQLLNIVAQRLREAVRESDTIARLSADEFVLILHEGAEDHLSPVVVQRIMASIAQPIVIEGYEFVMGCCVGIAVCPTDGIDADTLIKHSGIAMYRAKETGRNSFQFYTSSMNEQAMERLRLESDLRNALDRNEFVLHYQPQVDLATGRILGVEALIRWRHPMLGAVPPGRFIALAEEMGLIVPIGNWVLRAACEQSVAWLRAGYGQVRVAVNLSPRQFYQQDLVSTIKVILDETGIAPHLLELELTESMMMNDVEHAVAILRKLKAIGVHLSIDDFGTGYSSLSYLRRFPIDLLKIDQSFVRDITVDPDDAAIVLSIISLAHSLRLKVIAEGVETEAQLSYLQRHGCDLMQGFYFSKPLPVEDCTAMLRNRRRLPPALTTPLRQTLLIVDDEPGVASALKRTLRSDGYEVLIAMSPAEAFELLGRHQVQVVLCDQRMPGMSGSELLSRISTLYPGAVRVMMSGHAAFDSIVDAVNLGGIFRFYAKPWDEGTLRDGIRDAFRHYWTMQGAAVETDGGAEAVAGVGT